MATTPVAGSYYETGGSILHPSNKYMANFVQELGKLDGQCIQLLDCFIRAVGF